MMEIDHDIQQVYCEQMKTPDEALGILVPNEESVSQRLTTPIVTTYVDTDKISFERYVQLRQYVEIFLIAKITNEGNDVTKAYHVDEKFMDAVEL
jgi:hypothetical protein